MGATMSDETAPPQGTADPTDDRVAEALREAARRVDQAERVLAGARAARNRAIAWAIDEAGARRVDVAEWAAVDETRTLSRSLDAGRAARSAPRPADA